MTGALLHDLGHFLVDEHNEEVDFLTEDLWATKRWEPSTWSPSSSTP